MTKDEALRMALDELCRVYHDDEAGPYTLEVIKTIKQALEQPEPEPVAHCVVRPLQGYESIPQTRIEWKNGKPVAGPLYTTPPKREPLTASQQRMLHDFPHLSQFYAKYALGPMMAPSCLCCGQQTHPVNRPVAVKHLELPGIVICKPCQEAAHGIGEKK